MYSINIQLNFTYHEILVVFDWSINFPLDRISISGLWLNIFGQTNRLVSQMSQHTFSEALLAGVLDQTFRC